MFRNSIAFTTDPFAALPYQALEEAESANA